MGIIKLLKNYNVWQWSVVMTVTIALNSCSSSRKVTSEPPKPTPVPKTTEVKPEKPIIHKPKTDLNISLILPFNIAQQMQALDDTSGNKSIDRNAAGSLQFAEGALMALDTLNASGLNVRLKMYDMPNDSSAFINLLYRDENPKADLIITSVNSSFAAAATRVTEKRNQVLVMLQPTANFDKANSRVYVASPSTATQCYEAAQKLVAEFNDSKLVVIARDIKRDKEIADLIRKPIPPSKQVYLIYNYAALDSLCKIMPAAKTVFLITSSDEDYVTSVLNQLNSCVKEKAIVVGLPTWENFESVDVVNLKNLRIGFFSPNYVDYSANTVKRFRKNFFNRYKSDPLFNSLQGYELTLTMCDKILANPNVKKGDPLLEYRFINDSKDGYFENKQIYLLEIKDFNLVPLKK